MVSYDIYSCPTYFTLYENLLSSSMWNGLYILCGSYNQVQYFLNIFRKTLALVVQYSVSSFMGPLIHLFHRVDDPQSLLMNSA